MMLIDKNTFSYYTVEKPHHSPSAPKNTFYANFKICLILSGEGEWEIEDKVYSIRDGDVVLLNIGQKRRFVSIGQKGLKFCAFVLGRNAFSAQEHFGFFLEMVKTGRNLIRNEKLSALLYEAYEEAQTNKPFGYYLISAKFTEFFIKAERECEYVYRPLTKDDGEMLDIMNFIDVNISNGISLKLAAEKAGMSESTFSRHFSAINGVSFKEYIVEKKIQLAINLLNTTNLKMIDIALESGFDSISGFYEAFKKITDTTPKSFRLKK